MKTAWGDVDVIDAHAHFFSHTLFACAFYLFIRAPQT